MKLISMPKPCSMTRSSSWPRAAANGCAAARSSPPSCCGALVHSEQRQHHQAASCRSLSRQGPRNAGRDRDLDVDSALQRAACDRPVRGVAVRIDLAAERRAPRLAARAGFAADGRLGSSTFRLSTTAVSMSPTGSRFSSESAPRPFLDHGDPEERRWSNLRGGLAVDRRQVQADMRTHLIHRPARDIIQDRLRDIETNCCDRLHARLLPIRGGPLPWRSCAGGGAVHSIRT